jgi:hypothetical protein
MAGSEAAQMILKYRGAAVFGVNPPFVGGSLCQELASEASKPPSKSATRLKLAGGRRSLARLAPPRYLGVDSRG